MKFRLIHKKLGVKSTDIFSEFEYPNIIRDIYFVKDIGFLCLCEDSIMLLTQNDFSPVLSIKNPMSICSGLNNSVYVLYNEGIKNIDYSDNYYATDILNYSERDIIFGKLAKTGIHGMSIDAYGNTIGICVSPTHKFYKINKTFIEGEFGNGIPEYSLSSNLSQCSFCNPSGILVYDSDTLFIADTGNGCIRSFGKTHRIISGKPLDQTLNPTKLLIDRKKDILYYLSKNYLRSVSVDGSKEAMLYESDYISSMVLAQNDKIYILETIGQ